MLKRDVKVFVIRVGDMEEVPVDPIDLDGLDIDELADAVSLVDDVIAGAEILARPEDRRVLETRGETIASPAVAEKIAGRDQGQFERRNLKSALKRRVRNRKFRGRGSC